jgi:hypothetical protein
MNRYALAEGWSQFMYFTLLGVVLFAFPADVSRQPEDIDGLRFCGFIHDGADSGTGGQHSSFYSWASFS